MKAETFNGKWIPCSEKLPEEELTSVLVTTRYAQEWPNEFDNYFGPFACKFWKNGKLYTWQYEVEYACYLIPDEIELEKEPELVNIKGWSKIFYNEEGFMDCCKFEDFKEIVAWMPCPEPYHIKDLEES